jgi:PAN domain.
MILMATNGKLIFMKVFLVFLLLTIEKCTSAQNAVWNWTHPEKRTIQTENGELLTFNNMQFKRVQFYYAIRNGFYREENTDRVTCANNCMEKQSCITANYNADTGICFLYNFTVLARPHDVVTFYDLSDQYVLEVKVC